VTWVKLDTGILTNGVWSSGLDLRVWLWLLCKAKHSTEQGTVRFSYPVVAKQVAWVDGTKVRTPDRKTLRRCLKRLAADGRLMVDEWVQGSPHAVTQGGAQGYVTVRLCNFSIYQGDYRQQGQGVAPGVDLGVVDQRPITRPSKKRKKESEEKKRETPSLLSSGDDESRPGDNGKAEEPWGQGFDDDRVLGPGLAYLWNEVARQHGCPRVTAFPPRRQRAAKNRAREESNPRVWASAFHAICSDDFMTGKNDRDRVFATFDYALSNKGDRWLDEARARLEGEIL